MLPDRTSAIIRAILEHGQAPGASVAVLVDGAQIVSAGIGARGHAGPGKTGTVEPGDQTYLYSVTKVLLAAAALRLVDLGSLTLDGPVAATLADLPGRPLAHGVTLRHLLRHTAGIPDYAGTPAYGTDLLTDPASPWTDAEFLGRTLAREPSFPAGQGWSYSNVGYLLVRRLIEVVTHRPIADAMRDLVLAPLGLSQTRMATGLSDGRSLTPGWTTELDADHEPRDMRDRYHPGWVSHGTAISTAGETATLLDGLLSGRLLAPETLGEMLTPVPVPGPHPVIRRPGYGLGLMLDLASPWGLVSGHGGEGPGYSTAAFHFPNVRGHRVTTTALVNRSGPNLGLRVAFLLAESVADGTVRAD